jgi:diguanylate cyclase (GGDEF)-like protein
MTAPGDFEDLFQRAPFGYLATTVDGAITQINDTLLGWLARDRDAVVGTEFGALLDAGSRLFFETRHRPTLLLQERVDEVALTLVRADGSSLAVLANTTVVADDRGDPLGVRIALLDSAQRHEYERTLLQARRNAEQSEGRIRVLQSSGAAFIAADTEAELAESLADSAMTAFDAATTTVLLSGGADGLVTVAGTPRSPARGGPVLVAFETRTPVVVQSLDEAEREYPEFVASMRDARIDALTAVPLLDGSETMGVLVCTFGRERRFDDDAVALLTALALQASLALARLRLQGLLEQMALHDPLTGLANRQLLHDQADRARAAAERSGRPLSVVFFDLDGFKAVNDRLGHRAGDVLLTEVASGLRGAVRSADFAARFGGDEFVVVCEDADADGAALVAERIREAVGALDGITASIGVATLAEPGAARITTDEVLERADAAMYESKKAGGDRVTVVAVDRLGTWAP